MNANLGLNFTKIEKTGEKVSKIATEDRTIHLNDS
jgi:hypothetical protein